jgi:peptidoglycan/LPS O-acetylase OafA/YrhL
MSPLDTTNKSSRWHLNHLDSLRGIAVLGVIFVHAGLLLNIPKWLSVISFTGQRGVQLFFLVSAFTLFLSHDKRRDELNPTLNFFLRRFFRLFPMFYIATALACVLQPQYAGPPIDVVLSLLFLHGFTPRSNIHGALGGWSVAAEAIFYMFLPFLFRKVRSLGTSLWLFVLLAPCMYVVTNALALSSSPAVAEFWTFLGFPVQLPVFVMGIASYFFWKDYIADPGVSRPSKQAALLLLASSAAFYVLELPFNNRGLYFSSAACALLMMSLSIYPWKALVNHYTELIGKISFSVYLLHFYPLIELRAAVKHYPILVAHPILQFVVILSGTTILTLPLAYLTWRYIEQPGIAVGRRLISILENRSLNRQRELEAAARL